MNKLYIFFAFVFLLHIVSLFFPNPALSYLLGFLTLMMIVIGFRHASRLFQILGSGFTVVGIFLFFTTDLSVSSLVPIVVENLSLLTLLAVLPWMNSVVAAGRFDKLMQHLLRGNVIDLG